MTTLIYQLYRSPTRRWAENDFRRRSCARAGDAAGDDGRWKKPTGSTKRRFTHRLRDAVTKHSIMPRYMSRRIRWLQQHHAMAFNLRE